MTRISLLRLSVGLALAACFSCSEELVDEDLRLAPQSRSMAELVAFLEEHPVHPGRIEPQRIDVQAHQLDYFMAWIQVAVAVRLLGEQVDLSAGWNNQEDWLAAVGLTPMGTESGRRLILADYEVGSVEHLRMVREVFEGGDHEAWSLRGLASAFAELTDPSIRAGLSEEARQWVDDRAANLTMDVESSLSKYGTGLAGLDSPTLQDCVLGLLFHRRVHGEVPAEWVAQVADNIHEEVGDGSRNWKGVHVCDRATAMLFFAEFGIPEWCAELGVPSEWEDHWTQCIWSELSAAMWAKAVD